VWKLFMISTLIQQGSKLMIKRILTISLLGLASALIALTFTGRQVTRAQTLDFLHTNGSQIVDANGNQVILTGISWFGLETESFAPHGLWARNWESILDQIVELGFNTIRLPYSNQLFDPGSVPNGINYELNPDLKGLNGLEIMDKLIQGAGQRGLKIILDRHRPDSHAQSELWYTSQYSEERWIQDWVMLAKRYAGNDTVIGVDLHNEPHGQATWGSGDPATDWRLAAEKAGNAILAVNPNLLIIVEGIEQYQGDWYWWGGNLMGARDNPVRLDRPQQLVYSTHVYGPGVYPQPWFSAPNFPDNLAGIWDSHWGYLKKEGIAPVLLGEFGGRSVGDDPEGTWQRTLVSYLRENDISYMYWTINPDSGDTGGLLLDDWQSIDPAKKALLSGYQFSIIGIEQQGTPSAQTTEQAVQPSTQPTQPATQPATQPTPTLAPISATLSLRYRTANPAGATQDSKPEFIIANTGDAPVPLDRVELFYWFSDSSGQSFVYHCDWAQVGCANVQGDFNGTGDRQYLRLYFSQAAGELAPGQDTGEIKIRFNRADWSPFQQDGHFSFSPLTDYTTWDRVTLYVDGKLVWGNEPGSPATPTAQMETAQVGPSPVSTAIPASQTPASDPTVEPTPSAAAIAALVPTAPAADSNSQAPSALTLFLAGMLTAFGISLLLIQIIRRLRFSQTGKEAGRGGR
jgi:endoglucanase